MGFGGESDNYAGHAEFGIGRTYVCGIGSHVDVVPAGDRWDSDPFTLTQKRRFIIGKRCWTTKGKLP